MRTLFHSLLGRRTRQARSAKPAKELPRRRPEVEALEDRALPSISLPTAGHPGPVVITGTSGPDQFVIRLQASPASGGTTSPTNIQFSDDGGKTFQTAALADVTQVMVDGAGGTDLLTLDMGNGLIGNTATGGLPIQFTGTSGHQILDVTGNPGGTVSETFTLGANGSASTLLISNGTSSTTISVNASTPVVDNMTAANFTFNGTAGNDLIQLRSSPGHGHSSLVISGLNAFAVPGSVVDDNGDDQGTKDHGKGDDKNGQGDDNHDDKMGVFEFEEDQDETAANAFASLVLSNKANVTVNGLGGNDLFVANVRGVPTGLKSLTIDGGTGTNVLVGRALPTGITTNLVNITRQDTDPDDIFIDDLFAEALNRPADQAAINFFRGVLSSSGRLGVIENIENSLEARTDRLETFFQHLLGRDLDNAAKQFFLGLFAQGASDEQVEANILGSQEFQARAHSLVGAANQSENFVRAASRMLLNRDADDKMLPFFENLEQSSSAAAAALAMMQSQEFRTLATGSFFQTLLGRDLDDAGKAFFTSLPPSTSLDQLFALIAQSDEFFSRG